MDNLPLPVLVALAVFFGVIGLIFGILLGSLRRRKKDETVLEVDPMPPAPPPAPARNTPKDSIELLSIWRNERTGKLVAFLETKPLSPSHMSTEQKDKVAQILAGLRSMVGEPTPPPTPAIAERTPEPFPVQNAPALTPLTMPTESPPVSSEITREEAPGVPLGITPPPQAEKVYFADTLPEPVGLRQALSSNPFKINVPASSQKPTNAPKTIVEQIDEIFQAKLVGSPYADQQIQLKEAPDGMSVFIGSYKYEGIDAVPDPAIRALIKESAREWNEKVSRRK